MTRIEALAPAEALGAWLAEHTADPRWADCSVSLVSGGKSNLTFRVTSAAGVAIGRRPPAGTHPPGAHDVLREARVQIALADSLVPVPSIIGTDAGTTLGAPFYVMRAVEGHCIRETLPDGYASTPQERQNLAYAMVDAFSELHRIDPDTVGLGDLGRPAGFTARQVARWTRQWARDATEPVPAVDELASWLAQHLPTSHRVAIVHGDCKLDNLLVDSTDPSRVAAVLDWEMSTLGDPLADLALLLLFWREPGEPGLSIAPGVSALQGFPSRSEMVQRYARRHDVDELDLTFHRGLAHLKFAVILQGIARRSRAGSMAGQDYDDADAEVELVAREGLDIVRSIHL